jgi:hypothetical protein
MRGLMHTGESKTPGGRHGEAAATGISAALIDLGFELGRLKTGTPPRLKKSTIDWHSLPEARGDAIPIPFSDLTVGALSASEGSGASLTPLARAQGPDKFPALSQVDCRQTQTSAAIHSLIRANLHRRPCTRARSSPSARATARASRTRSCASPSATRTPSSSSPNPSATTGSTATASHLPPRRHPGPASSAASPAASGPTSTATATPSSTTWSAPTRSTPRA